MDQDSRPGGGEKVSRLCMYLEGTSDRICNVQGVQGPQREESRQLPSFCTEHLGEWKSLLMNMRGQKRIRFRWGEG